MAMGIFWFASLLLVYVVFVFILSPFVFPHLWRIKVPAQIPKDMQDTISRLSAENTDFDAFLRSLFTLLKNRYIIKPSQTHTMPWILFRKDINQIWSHVGSNQTCTILNFVLKTALVHSGRLKDSDIREHLTIFNTNMHQYLLVQSPRGVVGADPWGYLAGKADVGEYCTGFGKSGTPLPTA